jgi:hypothetical protein
MVSISERCNMSKKEWIFFIMYKVAYVVLIVLAGLAFWEIGKF